jgi:hypothetical protein
MRLPYVIDNRAHKLADVLNDLLQGDAVHALDVATATFDIGVTDLPESCQLSGRWNEYITSTTGARPTPWIEEHTLRSLSYRPFLISAVVISVG